VQEQGHVASSCWDERLHRDGHMGTSGMWLIAVDRSYHLDPTVKSRPMEPPIAEHVPTCQDIRKGLPDAGLAEAWTTELVRRGCAISSVRGYRFSFSDKRRGNPPVASATPHSWRNGRRDLAEIAKFEFCGS
jgi:hypothetical protein